MQCLTVTINESEPPVFINPPSDITLDCLEEIPTIMPLVWTDNCDATGMAIGSETGIVDCMGGTIIRTWEYTDACGNSAQSIQSITVSEIPPATIQNLPADLILNCGEILPPITDLIYDNGLTGVCQDMGMISGTLEDFSDGCSGFAVYTWNGMDNCGNPLIHTRTVSYIVPCATSYNLTGIESAVADFESSGTISSTQTIESTASIDYDSATDIELNAGFEVILGAVFEAFIDGCNNGAGGVNLQETETAEEK